VKTIPKRGYVLDVPIVSNETAGQAASGDEPPAGDGSTRTPPSSHEADSAETVRPRDAQRRHVTVMACNIVGLTTLARGTDPEDVREILAAVHGCVRQVVERRGGLVEKLLTDGLLAYFGYPQALEDDPERAVQAALAVTKAVEELKIELLSKGLQARI